MRVRPYIPDETVDGPAKTLVACKAFAYKTRNGLAMKMRAPAAEPCLWTSGCRAKGWCRSARPAQRDGAESLVLCEGVVPNRSFC